MRRVLLILLLATTTLAQTIETPPRAEAGRAVQAILAAGRLDELRWPDFSDYRHHVRNFYGPAGWELAWMRDGRVTPQAKVVIAHFEAADAKGVNATDYDGGRWRDRLRAIESAGTNDAQRGRFDLAVTISLMRYISDLHIGRINPQNIHFDLDVASKKYYLPKLVADIRDAADPSLILAFVEPTYEEYRRLQDALAQYRRFAAEAADEQPLPVVEKLKAGDAYPALEQLARILRRVGDLPADAKVGATYDGAIVAAVKRFQSRHGLEADGVISAKTFRELNVPLARRVQQIQWALERWRWAPDSLGGAPIVVNLPEFVLRGWDDEQHTSITMRVVVGQAYTHQTPVFVDEMTYVVFRPHWNVPPSIQRKEIVPKAEKNPGWLARNGYEIVNDQGLVVGTSVDKNTLAGLRAGRLRVRQKPGPSNALGLVKFMFPNQNNVYLHSTPAQALFSRTRRDFSHGCIRVAEPVKLAQWVLRDQPEWTEERIRAAMDGTAPTTVRLREPIPIMIIYATAVALEDGSVHFFEDVYGHDTTLENALAAGYPYPS